MVAESPEAAKQEAVESLAHLVKKGRYEWKWGGSAHLKALPVPDLPVRVFADSAPLLDGGWGPCLAMMAGKKFSGSYWQYTTCDVSTGEPHPVAQATEDIERLLDVMVPVVTHRRSTGRIKGRRTRSAR